MACSARVVVQAQLVDCPNLRVHSSAMPRRRHLSGSVGRLVAVGLVSAATLVSGFVAAPASAGTPASQWVFPRYGNHGFPPAADESRARVLRFRDAPSWFRLRVAPAKGGITCYIMHLPDGSGTDQCPRDAATRRMSRFGPQPLWRWNGQRVRFGTVESVAASVDLVYTDGSRATTRPTGGFVAFGIPAGKRLAGATIRASDGSVVRRITFP